MCVVADPPTFIPMFKDDDPEHGQFAPVMEWITNGPGKFVVGGSTYQRELMSVKSVIPFLTELERKRKVVRLSHEAVDAEELQVKTLESSTDFDDPHLVALVRVTGCKIICIRDLRSHKFLRQTKFYGSPKARPRLYTRSKNRVLLCSKQIAPCCK